MGKIFKYTVISNKQTAPSTLVLTLASNKRATPMPFRAGQYAAINFAGKNHQPASARCFSVACSPTEQGFLQFGIPIGGSYPKSALDMLVPGTKVYVDGPFGDFVYDEVKDTSAMLLADESGIAPFLSMIRYATRLQLPNQIALVYNCPTQAGIPFLAELMELRKLNEKFATMFVIGAGPADMLDDEYISNGQINGQLLDYIVADDYARRSYFICGALEFMTEVSALLLDKGVAPESVKTEEFTQGQLKHDLPVRRNV